MENTQPLNDGSLDTLKAELLQLKIKTPKTVADKLRIQKLQQIVYP